MKILTVSQVATYLRELLETDLALGDMWVVGEVSGPRTQPSGHTYFVLKDAGAQLRSVLFRATQQRQRRMVDYLTQGAQVIVHGRLTVYEARGELQIVVDFVQPEGVGLAHAQFERLRAQLEEEGLFDVARKRPLPAFPQRIGVVTSPAGAVFHDICNVLRRRWPLAEVVLAPTPVQGNDAPLGIVAAIERLNEMAEVQVIIVARGGGAAEELLAFNDERVARAVFGSLIPTVSAVGHETDFTICDYVADMRAPTPSAAAELVAPAASQVLHQVGSLLAVGGQAATMAMSSRRVAVEGYIGRGGRAVADTGRLRQRLDYLIRRAEERAQRTQRERWEALRRCGTQLDALNPQATLNRGYAVVHKDGVVVSSIAAVSTDDSLTIKVADGGFQAVVSAAGKRRRRAPAKAVNGSRPEAEKGVQGAFFL
jgi:exodeoxyribonuclease VII large subunit